MDTVRKYFILSVLAVPFAVFGGCNDKDDDDSRINMAEVTGNYTGEFKLMNILPVGEKDIVIKEKDADHVSMDLGVMIRPSEGTAVSVTGMFVHKVTKASSERYTLESATESVEVGYTISGVEQPVMQRDVKAGGIAENRKIELNITLPLPEKAVDVFIETIKRYRTKL